MNIPQHILDQIPILYADGITNPEQIAFMLSLDVDVVVAVLKTVTTTPKN